jgi:hypothetical protein
MLQFSLNKNEKIVQPYLIIEPLHQEDAVIRQVVIHGSAPGLLQLFLRLERAPLHPVAVQRAGSRQAELLQGQEDAWRGKIIVKNTWVQGSRSLIRLRTV